MENGENAGKHHFLLYPQYFLPKQEHRASFEKHLNRPRSTLQKKKKKPKILDSTKLKTFADDKFNFIK